MKYLKFLCSAVTALCIFASALPASAEGCARMDWSLKRNGKNEQPDFVLSETLLKEYGVLYMGEKDDKTVYLTFDAGYSNENVEKTLDVLKSRGIKAAFFILPGIIKNSPDIVKRMESEGHTVCNHSTHHADMSKITDIKSFVSEIEGVEADYRELTGKEMSKYFRPPEGAFSLKTLEFCAQSGYTPVFWSFAYADWDNKKQPNPEKAKEKILSRIHDGAVILLHPTSKTNADILEDVINALSERGYSFGTLDELKAKSY